MTVTVEVPPRPDCTCGEPDCRHFGFCRVCHRWKMLKADGTLRHHAGPVGSGSFPGTGRAYRCDGAGLAPLGATAAPTAPAGPSPASPDPQPRSAPQGATQPDPTASVEQPSHDPTPKPGSVMWTGMCQECDQVIWRHPLRDLWYHGWAKTVPAAELASLHALLGMQPGQTLCGARSRDTDGGLDAMVCLLPAGHVHDGSWHQGRGGSWTS